MPTYEYVCRDCGQHLEVVQSFRDDPLTTCGRCQGALRKVFSPAGVIFKGSGYYVTDSRSKAKSPAGAADGDSGSAKSTADKGKDSSPTTADSDSAAKSA